MTLELKSIECAVHAVPCVAPAPPHGQCAVTTEVRAGWTRAAWWAAAGEQSARRGCPGLPLYVVLTGSIAASPGRGERIHPAFNPAPGGRSKPVDATRPRSLETRMRPLFTSIRRRTLALAAVAALLLGAASVDAHPHRRNNPPGPAGGPGTNWRNPPGPVGGPGASRYHRHVRRDRDNNPPGPAGGAGTNWENPPGPRGGPGASPDRRGWRRWR